jgi:hypothetical protein
MRLGYCRHLRHWYYWMNYLVVWTMWYCICVRIIVMIINSMYDSTDWFSGDSAARLPLTLNSSFVVVIVFLYCGMILLPAGKVMLYGLWIY